MHVHHHHYHHRNTTTNNAANFLQPWADTEVMARKLNPSHMYMHKPSFLQRDPCWPSPFHSPLRLPFPFPFRFRCFEASRYQLIISLDIGIASNAIELDPTHNTSDNHTRLQKHDSLTLPSKCICFDNCRTPYCIKFQRWQIFAKLINTLKVLRFWISSGAVLIVGVVTKHITSMHMIKIRKRGNRGEPNIKCIMVTCLQKCSC